MKIKTAETVNIGKRIKLAIAMKLWTQSELANKMDVVPQEVSRWVSGQYLPDAWELKKISELTEQPLDFFFEEFNT